MSASWPFASLKSSRTSDSFNDDSLKSPIDHVFSYVILEVFTIICGGDNVDTRSSLLIAIVERLVA